MAPQNVSPSRGRLLSPTGGFGSWLSNWLTKLFPTSTLEKRSLRRRLEFEQFEERITPASGNVFTVLNTDDNGGVDPAAYAGTGTLRQAIIDANATAGADIIRFNIGFASQQTISLASALPTITEAVILDGSTEPGFEGGQLIILTADDTIDVVLTVTGSNVAISYIRIDTPNTALNLSGADNAVLNNLNLSYTSETQSGIGVLVDGNAYNVLIQNNFISNKTSGIKVDGASDVQILDNNLSSSGGAGGAALALSNITADTLTGGVLISGNSFGGVGGNNAVYLANMSDLTISDGTMSGTNVSLGYFSSVSGTALHLDNVSDSSISTLDLTYYGEDQLGIALLVEGGSSNIVIDNVTARYRDTGIMIDGATDVQVLNNNLTDSGDKTGAALSLANITANQIPGGVLVSGNLFGGYNSLNAVHISNMSGLLISDGSVFGTNIALAGINGVRDTSLHLSNVSQSVIDSLDVSRSSEVRSGTGLLVDGGSSNLLIRNISARDRTIGIQIDGGSDIRLSDNYLGFNETGVYLSGISDGADPDIFGATIVRSEFLSNSTGLSLANTPALVSSNSFIGNTSGLTNAPFSATTDARNNYWGASNGPQNLGGQGDSYSGDVNATPFLTDSLTAMGANPQGLLIRPIVGTVFTVDVGTFTIAGPTNPSSLIVSIDWGDETYSPGFLTELLDGSFLISGAHTYDAEGTYLVSFDVSDPFAESSVSATAGSAVTLTPGQNNQLSSIDFQYLAPGGGNLSAATTGISAAFVQPNTAGTSSSLSVVKFNDAPVEGDIFGAFFPEVDNPIADHFDVRVTGAEAEATLTVTFNFTGFGSLPPKILYYDSTTEKFVEVKGSTRIENSLVIDLSARTVTIIFDSTSNPNITSLGGTVFTIAVAAPSSSLTTTSTVSATTTTTTTSSLSPATSLALTNGSTTTDASNSSQVTLSFQSSSKVQLQVNATQDSTRSAASSSSNSKEEEKKEDEETGEGKNAKEPGKKDKEAAKKQDDEGQKTAEKVPGVEAKIEKPDMVPATPGVKVETKSSTSSTPDDAPMEQKQQEQQKEGEQSVQALDTYFAWSAAGIGVLTPLLIAPSQNKPKRNRGLTPSLAF